MKIFIKLLSTSPPGGRRFAHRSLRPTTPKTIGLERTYSRRREYSGRSERGGGWTGGPQINQRFSKTQYISTVEKLRQHILKGDCYEINFCQEFYAENIEMDPVELYLKLK